MAAEAQAARRAKSATIFSALGDVHRLELLHQLSSQDALSISALTANTNVTRQAVTKHLHVLTAAGLVCSERAGREHVFRLSARGIREARAQLELISRQWDRAIERLRAFVEDG